MFVLTSNVDEWIVGNEFCEKQYFLDNNVCKHTHFNNSRSGSLLNVDTEAHPKIKSNVERTILQPTNVFRLIMQCSSSTKQGQ